MEKSNEKSISVKIVSAETPNDSVIIIINQQFDESNHEILDFTYLFPWNKQIDESNSEISEFTIIRIKSNKYDSYAEENEYCRKN